MRVVHRITELGVEIRKWGIFFRHSYKARRSQFHLYSDELLKAISLFMLWSYHRFSLISLVFAGLLL